MKTLTTLLVASVLVAAQQPATGLKAFGENPVKRLAQRVQIGASYHYKNLTIFPLRLDVTFDAHDYLTLDAAFLQNALVVREIEDGEVNTVQLKNKGDRLVFGMSGEVVSGAKQDRMLENDILIPPRSGWLRVPVYCVEHGRWIATSPEFSSKGLAANPGLRQRAAETKNQSEVWNEVASARADLGVSGATGALARVYDQADVQSRSRAYEDKFRSVPSTSPLTVGVVVAVGDRIVCADIFASHALFNRMWSKLLRSYVIDALRKRDEGDVSRNDVRDFLDEVGDARLVEHGTPGRGDLYEIHGDLTDGSALVYGSSVVHFDLFPRTGNVSLPADDRSVPRLDIRRNGHFRE